MRKLAKWHLITVGILIGVLIALIIFMVMFLLQLGPFKPAKIPKPDSYLKEEEVVVIPSRDAEEEIVIPIKKVLFEYIEIVDGCGPYFEEACVNMRSGPGEDFPVVTRLRNGIVLKIGGSVERDGRTWYKIVFDEWIRYPKRLEGNRYVAADYVRVLLDEGDRNHSNGTDRDGKKRIVVDRSEQMLYAYDGEELFMKEKISTGIELTPTPRGMFTIFKKTPSRYMQGPIPEITEKEYDLPGVPWNLYFTEQGAVIHGAYWHNNFGKVSSSGCVNLPPAQAQKLYMWADVGTSVIVQD